MARAADREDDADFFSAASEDGARLPEHELDEWLDAASEASPGLCRMASIPSLSGTHAMI